MRTNTDWFLNARWGLLIHFLAMPPSSRDAASITPEEWNRWVDGFDVAGVVKQVREMRAGYYILTLGQNTGFFCSPNETYDSLVGRHPSRLSRRDLMAELADALEAEGIRAMAYLPSHAPASDRQAVEALQCTPAWDASRWGLRPGSYLRTGDTDARLTAFQRNWEAIVREWSERWGRKVHGWWIDGCYHADLMYRADDAPNFSSFAAALKAGNPHSIVAFNPGVKMPILCHSEHDDYTAGEVNELPAWHMHKPAARFVDGAQLQVLTYLGTYWRQGDAPRFPDPLAVGYTQYVNSLQGVMTWDVPIGPDGLIPKPFMRQLRLIGQAARDDA